MKTSPKDKMKKLLDILKDLTENNFFGIVKVTFRGGKVASIKKEENLKLD